MKTAISIPDGVFQAAERLARRLRVSRSELYAKAVSVFVQQHDETRITDRLDEVYAVEDASVDSLVSRLQALSIQPEEW